MKFFRLSLLAVALLLIPVSQAAATVVIYKGSAKILKGTSVKAATNVRTVFWIMDFNTLEGTFVFAQRIDDVKSIYNDGSRTYSLAEVPTKPKPTIFYTSADGSPNPPFTNRGVRLRGTKSSFTLAANATLPALIPKSLTGSVSFVFGTPLVFDGTVAMTFDKARTFDSNLSSFTVSQAAADIIAKYVNGKGYKNIVQ